jgi:hypothetical protein
MNDADNGRLFGVEDGRVARGAAIGAAVGYVVVAAIVTTVGVLASAGFWTAIGLGLFAGLWGGPGFGGMLGAIMAVTRASRPARAIPSQVLPRPAVGASPVVSHRTGALAR